MDTIREDEVTYTLVAEPSHIPVRGNALASGDDSEDRRAEDEIIERLDSGDVWAWADVVVYARWRGFEGWSALGACSYKDEADFTRPGDYYDDMKAEALENLREVMADTAKRLGCS